ncbi:hypothetical protein AAFF_G00301520 [Aldrovandia affinis]|uniref:Uncharacterized protein n=1 Tax=Aldrovandia affinis TaxID=143900 RepID=A0AAD7SQU1_9TELE|nr:hypothetical protein AAFF_G00301520 [Aldrovandia affinis]
MEKHSGAPEPRWRRNGRGRVHPPARPVGGRRSNPPPPPPSTLLTSSQKRQGTVAWGNGAVPKGLARSEMRIAWPLTRHREAGRERVTEPDCGTVTGGTVPF